MRTLWTHWAIFEFTTVYDAKRNRTEEVHEFAKLLIQKQLLSFLNFGTVFLTKMILIALI